MNYPLISEYVDSILLAEDNFSTLTNLRPVLKADGKPYMSSGNFAVVFKMKDVDTGKLYAVKCFTKEEELRNESYKLISEELEGVEPLYLTPISYLEKELFVDSNNSKENEFAVLLMDWVDGKTLDVYLRENHHDGYKLSMLCYNFCRMSGWLLTQPFAHGDLKPDNIMVKSDGSLVLVDYDGMFVPAMKGQKARELGSPDYRHPLRTENDFDEHTDDFSLASIALSLKLISLNPSLLDKYGAADRLLFSANDYADLSKSMILREIATFYSDAELVRLHGMFLLAYAQQSLSPIAYRMFNLSRPQKEDIISPAVTKEDLAEGWEDEYGVLYSKDGKRLLKCRNDELKEYTVRKGTKVICYNAFSFCERLSSIELPSGLTSIGDCAFSYCMRLSSIELPSSLTSIGAGAFSGCSVIQIMSKSPFFKVENDLLIRDKEVIAVNGNKKAITVPDYITSIGDCVFLDCKRLSSIDLPSGLTSIGISAFWDCKSLSSIDLPSGLTSIGESAFCYCSSLSSIELPSGLTSIGASAFACCKSLRSIELPSGLTSIGDCAFDDCESLSSIELPSGLTSIGAGAFNGCSVIQIMSKSPFFKVENDLLIRDKEVIAIIGNKEAITVSDYINSIGRSAFWGCKRLSSIDLPSGLTLIGESAFRYCKSLRNIDLPSSLTSIGRSAFESCESLSSIELPSGLTLIGESAFRYCKSLRSIELPSGLTSIGNSAFEFCDNLTKVYVKCSQNTDRNAVMQKFKKLLPSYLHDKLEILTELDEIIVD